jgi:hypothetical protein
MNIKNIGVIALITVSMLLSGSVGYLIAQPNKPLYNRVYTSDHHSYEKAMHKVGIEYTNEQLNAMYELLH